MGRKNTKTSGKSAAKGRGQRTEAGLSGLLVRMEAGRYGSSALWKWVALTILLFLVLGFLYPGPVFEKQVFRSVDTQNSDAFASVGDRSLADGDYPHWNPYLFAGMPSFGSLAYTKFLYPPSVVLNFAQQRLGFPPLTWLLAHLMMGGLGMAWLLSRWKLPFAALLLGAVIWLMAPKIVAWGVHGHGSKLGAAMYLPWLVGWVWRILDGQGARAIGMTGILLGLQLLRGHVQITYYSLLVVGWLTLAHLVWPWDEAARALSGKIRWLRAGQVGLGLALGFLIGALLLVPVYEYAQISIRGQDTVGGGGVGLDYATGWSLAPVELPTLLFPAAAGFGKATYVGAMPFNDYPNYLGVLTLLLAVLSWRRGGRRLTIVLVTMSLLAILVAFGRHGPGLYELLYHWLPYFNKFRIPSMILILVTFVGAILAARGAAAWADGSSPGGPPRLYPALFLGIGLVCLLAAATSMAKGPFLSSVQSMAASAGRETPAVLLDEAWHLHRSSLIRIGLILLVAGAAMLTSLKNASLRRNSLLWVLVGLVALDLYSVDRLIVRPETGLLQVGRDSSGQTRLVNASPLTAPWRPSNGAGNSASLERLANATGHQRVYPLGNQSVQNSWMAAQVRSLGGYHPAKLAAYEQIRRRIFSDRPAGKLVNWLGGSVLTAERPLAGEDLQALDFFGIRLATTPISTGSLMLYRNEAALPRARLVTNWVPVSDLPEKDALEPFLDALQGGLLPIEGVVRLDETPDPLPQKPSSPLLTPEFRIDGLDEVVLDVETPVPALLLLADMFAPGWQVQVDGEDRPLLRADLVLRAVALEAGSHEVRFVYHDPTVRTGLMASLGGWALALGLILVPLVRRTRSGSARSGVGGSGEKAEIDD